MRVTQVQPHAGIAGQGRRSVTGAHRVFQDASRRRGRGAELLRAEEQASGSVTTDLQESNPAGNTGDGESIAGMAQTLKRVQEKEKRKTKVESTDAVATFLTRRFGLAGGMAWLGVLAAGTIGEQVKTRLEVAAEENGKKDVLQAKEVEQPNGLRYTDMRLGAGQIPQKGDLVVLDYMLSVDGKVIEDTTKRGRPVVFVFGARPFSGGVCSGVEDALSSMRAGGRRRVVVPPTLGFPEGTALRPKEQDPSKAGLIPSGATLYYDLQLLRVSIAP